MVNLKRFEREFTPVLEQLRTSLEPAVGVLLWKDAREARLVTHTERRDFVRVGPIFGDGVARSTVDPDQVLKIFNKAAASADLHPAERTESVNGEFSWTADDQIGTTLELRIGRDVRIWMDTEALAE
uniref:hypothetical protein n=1 Tax=Tessaracoccus timonensis TaxID=2161816 RepID=UPI000D55A962|nr:hypothetical protein [Tessaracoccus timonensis]